MPSLALRTAWFKPRICEVILSEIAKPAASSLALLIRKPDDRRVKEVFSDDCDVFKLRCAFNEAIFELISCGI